MPFDRTIRLILLVTGILLAFPAASADPKATLPDGFVYLRDIDPTIRQDMRYAGPHNFTGRKVPGYAAAECVLAKPAAEALKAAQTELKQQGLSLKVYDCYRPERAVAAFVEWAKEPADAKAKRVYYPNLPKSALFPDYIATRSGHSRGATVDVTLVPLAPRNSPPDSSDPSSPIACTQADSGNSSLDMGTRFDCFDAKANTDAPGLTEAQQRNRTRLVETMTAHGFENYPKEFWHYTFQPEPYPDRYFDFPIAPRPSGGGPR